MDTVVSLETGAPLKAAEFNGKTALIFVCRIRGRRNIWCVWEEAAVPVCGRKAMAAEEWLAPLLCCGWSWKLEVWGLGSLLRGSYTTLAWLSWVDSGWQVEWLTRTGVGREAGKKRSRCSFVYLGVVGASLEACWRQKKKKKDKAAFMRRCDWPWLTTPCTGRLLSTVHPLPLRQNCCETQRSRVDISALFKHTSAVLVLPLSHNK